MDIQKTLKIAPKVVKKITFGENKTIKNTKITPKVK